MTPPVNESPPPTHVPGQVSGFIENSGHVKQGATPHSRWLTASTASGLLALFGILFFVGLGNYPLFDPDEPRYAEAARQMAVYGDWLTPHFNGALRLEKPVMFYWLVATAYKLFGISEFSARLISALAATLTGLMIFGFGRSQHSLKSGLVSASILSTSILFVGIARMAITDMTLTAWLTGASLCLYIAAHCRPVWWVAAGAFMGLALLTKGPVGFAIPLGVLGAYSLVAGWLKKDFSSSLRQTWLTPWMPAGILLALAIALPWYLMAAKANGPIFWESLLWNNVTRYSSVVSGHQQPGWYYLAVLTVGFLPWTPYLPAVATNLRDQLRQQSATAGKATQGYSLLLYVATWSIGVLVFFLAGQTRLPTYILPMFPPLALWLALSLPPITPKTSPTERWWHTGSWLGLVIALAGSYLLITRFKALLPHGLDPVTVQTNIPIACLLPLGAITTVVFMRRRCYIQAIVSQCLATVCVIFLVFNQLVPSLAKATQADVFRYLSIVGNSPLAIYDLQRPSLTYYGKRTVPRFGGADDPAAFKAWLKHHPQAYIVTRTKRMETIQAYLEEIFPNRVAKIEILDQDAERRGSKYNLLFIQDNSTHFKQHSQPSRLQTERP